ncbi:MAG TPA: IPT/TIG domain-containing protein [Ohtaekwangia sp.]|nr:IPT/TIG domain-containing protein [Ohtaekwangia sp.]
MKPYRLMMILTVISAGLLLSSCKDDDGDNSKIELHSFGPSGVKHGENIIFIGRNMDKVTSVILPGDVEVPSSSFISATKNQFEITVPAEAEEGKVILKTPQGDIQSLSTLSFEVAVVITSITAEAKPGTNITITGTNVNWIREIVFNNGVMADGNDFVSSSVNELVVTVPMEAQTGALIFTTGGTEPETFVSEEELIVTVPTVASLSPASIKHTDELTIAGTDLDLITAIDFTGGFTVSDFVNQTETEIVVAVPSGALKGTLTLKQASPIEVTTADQITIILPKGTNVNPSPATPGENITITGTNLDLVASLTLPFVEAPVPASSFVSQSPTQIVLTVPTTVTKNGGIIYTTIHGYSNILGVNLVIPGGGPEPLDYYIYDDELKNGWSNWGGWEWSEKDLASTEELLVGDKAFKVTFSGQYGAIQIGSPGADVFDGYTTLSFQVFVPAVQNLIVQIGNNADYYLTNLPQGWSQVQIPLADLAGSNDVGELRIKNNNANLPVTIYFDEIGLKN